MKVSSYLMPKDEDPGTNPKYYGRIPKYTHILPETLLGSNPIYTCNEEYIYLFSSYITGQLDERNISIELKYELEEGVMLIPEYGTRPMPEWDPLFECIFGPKDPSKQCEMIADSNCSLLVDSDGCFMAPYQNN